MPHHHCYRIWFTSLDVILMLCCYLIIRNASSIEDEYTVYNIQSVSNHHFWSNHGGLVYYRDQVGWGALFVED